MSALPAATGDGDALAARLRTLRLRTGLSMRQLSLRAGLSASTVRQIENGASRRPALYVLAGIAEALDLTPGERARFLGISKRPEPPPALHVLVGPSDLGNAWLPLGALLRTYRERHGWSQNALATEAAVESSYIGRIEAGERVPDRGVLHAVARALVLTPADLDRLLWTAGYLPSALQKLSYADATVAAVIGILTNDRIPPESRADFRACVETMAARWGRR